MTATLRLPRLGLLDIFENLVASHLVSSLGSIRSRRAERQVEEGLALMPPHLREDAGLPPLPPQVPEHPAITKARSRGRNWG
jgi:hypothetical protein